jgi:hypothetical protein
MKKEMSRGLYDYMIAMPRTPAGFVHLRRSRGHQNDTRFCRRQLILHATSVRHNDQCRKCRGFEAGPCDIFRHRHDEYNKLDFSVHLIIFAYRL